MLSVARAVGDLVEPPKAPGFFDVAHFSQKTGSDFFAARSTRGNAPD
jgi:hypothetical protein